MVEFTYRQKLAVWESDAGQAEGWTVEVDGVAVAEIDDQQPVEMFWDNCRVKPIAGSRFDEHDLQSVEFWCREGLVCRSKATDLVADSVVLSGGDPFPEPGRVVLRGLHLRIGAPSPLDQCMLAWRRWIAKR